MLVYEGHTDSVTSLEVYEGILFTASSDKTIKYSNLLPLSDKMQGVGKQ